MLISIVTPVYGCTEALAEIVKRTEAAFRDTELAWELLFVDDRGPDAPWPAIAKLAAADARVHGVRLMRNHGQHLAIWAGFAHARGDWIAVIDCDLQDDPAAIPDLYQRALDTSAEAVIVDRGDWRDSAMRRVASRSFYAVIERLSGFRLDINAGNFGLYSRRMVQTLLSFRDREVFLPVMAILTGLPRASYRLDRAKRLQGKSSYDIKRLLRFALALIIRFSDRPLKISVLLGLAFSSLSALIGAILFIAWLLGRIQVAGWTSLMLSVWFIGGLILFVLGLHGFYIGRIFMEVQRRPRVFVEEVTPNIPTLNNEI